MINEQEKQFLSDLVKIVDRLNVPLLLVGAGARLLIFDQQFGEGRGTKDWDVALSMDSWETYEELRQALIGGESPDFEPTRHYHKFKHIATQIEVDIVPFGEIGEPEQTIIWPDSGNSMNILGFTEALSYSKTVTIDNLEIQAINIPAFIVLKLFAWGDRGERVNKDLEDLEFVLSHYEDDERAYDELAEKLANGGIELLDASIYLLGQDIYKILQEKTRFALNEILNQLIARLEHEPPSLGYQLRILQRGINSLSSQTNKKGES